jgi:hypothetical protein
MRRSILAVVLVALAASLAGPISPATAGPGPDYLTITSSATYHDGDQVSILVNINEGTDDTFQATLETNKSGSYQPIAGLTDKTTNSYGKYTFKYAPTGEQDVRASWTQNGSTHYSDILHLNPLPPEVVAPTGPDTGNLYSDPAIVTEGQKVTITANFPSGVFDVKLYRETAPDVWTVIGTDESNSSGNAYFTDVVVNGTQKLFARKANNDRTEVLTLTPTVIVPENFPDTGSLSTPTSIYDGRTGTVTANFPSGTFGVTLFKETDPGVWTSVGQKTSNSSGDASFTGYRFDGTQTLFALTSKGQRTEVKTVVPKAPNEVTGGPATLGKNVIYVTTNNGGTPVTKGVDYAAKTVIKAGDVVSETLDLETIAVRGNSSADKDKKPYKYKFEDKQKPFGMKSDKTWILLANYQDWTLIRSMAAWDLGKMLDGLKWTPDSRYAELFLNGKYMGSYQIVQSIKIDSNRVNVSKTTGQVIEFDPHWKEDGIPGFIGKTGMNYAWKDPDEFKELDGGGEDPEGLTNAKISAMKTKIKNFENVLYGTDGTKDWSKVHYSTLAPQDDWMTYLDLNSAVDYYLAREFTKDNDADFYRSNFFYTNNVDPNSVDPNDPNDPDKFFMGPIWDFDRSAGAKPAGDTTVTSPTGWWIRGNGSPNHDTNKIHWFTRITKDPRFLKALHDRWAVKKAAFEAVGPTGVTAAVKKMSGIDDYDLGRQVAANDRQRWAGYGGRYPPKTSSYSAELDWVRDWYSDRYTWMNGELIKDPPPIPD